MKDKIHPKYHTSAKITCACGNEIKVGSTQEKMDVEVCSKCHPFFTGDMSKKVATGQVEKFRARIAKAKKDSKK